MNSYDIWEIVGGYQNIVDSIRRHNPEHHHRQMNSRSISLTDIWLYFALIYVLTPFVSWTL